MGRSGQSDRQTDGTKTLDTHQAGKRAGWCGTYQNKQGHTDGLESSQAAPGETPEDRAADGREREEERAAVDGREGAGGGDALGCRPKPGRRTRRTGGPVSARSACAVALLMRGGGEVQKKEKKTEGGRRRQRDRAPCGEQS